MAYYIPLGGVGVVRDKQGAGKELTVRCIWMKKHNSCGDCFLWGRACGEVDCEPEKREDGESVMFEEYIEDAKNTEHPTSEEAYRAALRACIEALEVAQGYVESSGWTRHRDDEIAQIEDAIINARKALGE